MKKVRKAATKELIVIARIKWNHEDKVCYLVRASSPLKDGQYRLLAKGQVSYNGEVYQSVVRNGERYLIYQVCFINGHIGGCTCPATGQCYHKKELAVIEAKRRETAAPAAAVEAEKIVVTATTTTEASAEVSDEELDAILAEIEAEHKQISSSRHPSDNSTRGNLNGDRAFGLMRK